MKTMTAVMGIATLLSQTGMSLRAGDGAWTGTGSGTLTYWDEANWLDGQIANGAGYSAYFTNALNPKIVLTNDVTLGYLQMYWPVAAGALTFEGGSLAFEGGSLTLRNDNRSLVFRTVLRGSGGLTKTGNQSFYPYRKSEMTGTFKLSGGTLGLDFRQDADSTNALALNHLQPDGLLFVGFGGQVRIGGRPSVAADKTGVFTLDTGSRRTVRVSGESAANLSAGQVVTAAAGVLPEGTFLRTIYDNDTIELSAAPLTGGDQSLTFKAATFTTVQEFNLLQTGVSGSLYVGAGAGSGTTTARIGELAGGYGLTGDGTATMEIQNTRDFGGVLSLTNSLTLALADQRAIPAAPATNAAFHVDASASGTLTTSQSGNNTLISKWQDKNGTRTTDNSNVRWAQSSGRTGLLPPFLIQNALNGLPVVDFGAAGSCRGLIWNDNIGGIRTVFIVVGSQAGGGLLLGNKDNNTCSFERGMDVYASKGAWETKVYTTPLTKNHALLWDKTYNNSAWLNGQPADFQYSGLSGDYDLFSFMWNQDTTGGSASGFAIRGGMVAPYFPERSGGQRLAEVILYQRALTDQERRDTEAYLYYKWFNKALAGYGAPKINTLRAQGGNALEQKGTNAIEVDTLNLLASASLTVKAGTQVNVKNAALPGRVTLAGGKLTFGSWSTPLAPSPQAALHLDAATNLTLSGSEITRWDDCDGGSRHAFSYDGFRPSVVPNALNGRPVVDFGAIGSKKFLAWDTNVVIRSLFLVMNLRDYNSAPLGTYQPMMPAKSHFTRQGAQIWNPNNPVTVKSGACYLDGLRVNPTAFNMTYNSFVLLGQVMEGSSIANAFACEAYLYTDPENRANRTGGMQLAEVLIYERKLSERESLDTQAYLNWKWFGRTSAGYAAPGGSVSLNTLIATASSALVIDGDAPVVLGSVSGAGDVLLESSAPVILASVADLAGGLKFTNTVASFTASQTLSSLAVLGASGVSVADGATLAVNTLTGSGTLTTSGEGTLALHAVSNFSGDLALTGGTLSVSVGNALDVGKLSAEGTGAFQLDFNGSEPSAGATPLITFDSLDGQSQSALLSGWQLTGVPSKFKGTVLIRDSTVLANLAALGTVFQLW